MSGQSELKINSQFAQKYDRYRQKEELQRLKDRYGDGGADSGSESSGSSSEDSDVELDPDTERDFYRTLSLLKQKDPKIYNKDAQFYAKDVVSGEEKPSTSKHVVKPMYLKDYERKVILERDGKFEDESDDDDDEEAARLMERASSPSYMQEQRELKESFQKFIQDSDEEDGDEGEGGGASHLLTRRIRTQEEKDQEEEDYVAWLKGQAELEGPQEVTDMKHLRDYWNDPQLDEKERFLRDYMLNKAYLEDGGADHRIPTYDELVQEDVEDSEEEGESFLERQENFERNYNFRFEEPDAQEIKTYPRNIATSVRSKDDRRKLKREEVKERKTKEKEQKKEQLKQLKNLKRKEILEKLKQLQDLTGNEQLAFSQQDLEGDFNPTEHDQLMQRFFGEDYYGQQEEDKPQFADEELEEHWNWDTWTGELHQSELHQSELHQSELHQSELHQSELHQSELHCEDQGFVMDADFDPDQRSTSKKKKKKKEKNLKKLDLPQTSKKRKKSVFAEAVTTAKPLFDPKERSFEQYLDEFYKLDYEDLVDDLPCRFRYRPVLANDFGLSTDEILSADDKDLNRWCSLKKTCMFRSEKEEHSDLKTYQIKAQNSRKKREILSSVYAGEEPLDPGTRTRTSENVSTPDSEEQISSTHQEVGEEGEEGEEEGEEVLIPKKMEVEEELEGAAEEKGSGARPRWLKKPQRSGPVRARGVRMGGVRIGGREFSRQRLKAYGLNPKRLYFRQLGRQRRKAQDKQRKNLQ